MRLDVPRTARIAGLVAAVVVSMLGLSTWPPVNAATLKPLSLDEMIGFSEEIVVGRVLATESHWEGKLIVTVATVQIEEAIKGANPTRIEITQLGGSAVHPDTGLAITMTASTHVALEPGEDLLLFVSRTPTGLRQLVGAHQGRYVIRRNAVTGARELPVGPKRLDAVRDTHQDIVTTEAITLDAMRERIRSHMDRQSIGGGGRQR